MVDLRYLDLESFDLAVSFDMNNDDDLEDRFLNKGTFGRGLIMVRSPCLSETNAARVLPALARYLSLVIEEKLLDFGSRISMLLHLSGICVWMCFPVDDFPPTDGPHGLFAHGVHP